MKVLLTGACGRIAQWVIPQLPPEWELVLTDRVAAELGGRSIRALDITDYSAVREAAQGVDVIVHLAIASSRDFVTDTDRFDADEGEEYLRFNEAAIEVNVRGTYHIFEAARDARVKRVVLGSSLTVLIGQPVPARVSDAQPYRPSNFYAVTKMWGEQLGEYYSRRHGITVYCLRFGNPYPQPESPKFAVWMKAPPASRSSVTFADLASSIVCAATVEGGPAFGAYTIVSLVENSRYDTSKAAEIGWRSRTRCEADGTITPLP